MNYILRPLVDSELNDVYDIKKKSNYDYIQDIWGWDEDYQYNDFITSLDRLCLKIIEKNGEILGFLELHESLDKINIREIHLLDEFQGFGIGSDIINKVLKEARSKNKSVEIGCFKSNKGAFKLYSKLGFNLVEETDTHFKLRYAKVSHD